LLLSDLLGTEVRDGRDRMIGRVQDVRVAQDGREIEGFGRAFRIQGILVGRRPGDRFALTRPDVKGPFLFKLYGRWVERRLRFVDWEQVRSATPGLVEIRSTSGKR
jgi:PRC-barrel domain